jgi:hypothetical protein
MARVCVGGDEIRVPLFIYARRQARSTTRVASQLLVGSRGQGPLGRRGIAINVAQTIKRCLGASTGAPEKTYRV